MSENELGIGTPRPWKVHKTTIDSLLACISILQRAAGPSLDNGMDEQITKPLTMAALTDRLLEWLAAAEAREA